MTANEIFERIKSLEGEPSSLNPAGTVWVPGVGNGSLKGLLEELLERGWEIKPPPEA